MKKRWYGGEVDLKMLQDFNAAAIAITNHCGYLHAGDIPHHIYNGNKYYDPSELLAIWEDAQGVAAWMLVQPRFKSFDAQVRPDLRGGDLEREVLDETEALLLKLMKKYEVSSDHIYADAFREDAARVQILSEMGWEPDNELPYVLNRTEIASVTVPELPDDYSFRAATGIEDAAALADVHNAAFNPTNWTPELYQKVMESPGYNPKRELVIQAPDGRLVAFCIIWFDNLNHMGLFEPVGTHRDCQRQGFGRAVMLYGLQNMADARMKYASVAHFGDNETARGLYQSLGFKPWHLEDGFTKPISK